MTAGIENAFSGTDSVNPVPSAPSYPVDLQSVGTSDSSVASNSVHGTTSVTGAVSPARSVAPTCPPSASNTPSPSVRRTNPDLLDGQQQQAYPTSRDRTGLTSSDDERTEPSSETGNHSEGVGYTRSDGTPAVPSTFGRLIESTKKRLNNRRRSNSDEDGEAEALESALIYGYLLKLGRNGKWQTRWFETDGECLTYYKCSKRVKLLATLDLAKVGSIVMNTEDRSATSFTINISERPYHLRADSEAACKDWVITLNRVKEARMLEGNVKLAKPPQRPLDLLDDYAPKVVVVANRQRTRAIDDDDLQSWESGTPWKNAASEEKKVVPPSAAGRLARWQKPRNSLSRLAAKLANWARSIRNHGCIDSENQVVLDRHLHPPGHDDAPSPSGSKPPAVATILSLDKSTAAKAPMGVGRDDEDDGVRHLS